MRESEAVSGRLMGEGVVRVEGKGDGEKGSEDEWRMREEGEKVREDGWRRTATYIGPTHTVHTKSVCGYHGNGI